MTAPLDPSKVKAGDTVTIALAEAGSSITGRVALVHPVVAGAGMLWFEHASGRDEGFTFAASGGEHWALAAHQPAPKPEPKPGTTGTATVRGVEGVKVMRRLVEHTSQDWTSDRDIGGWLSHSDAHVTDFVPDETHPLPSQDDLAEAIKYAHRLGGNLMPSSIAGRIIAHLTLRGESR